MPNDSDDLQWIKEYLVSKGVITDNFDTEKFERVRNFAFLWNLFEKDSHSDGSVFDWISRAVENLQTIPQEKLNSHIAYFKTRYITDGELNSCFNNLRFIRFRSRNRDCGVDAKDAVTKMLKGEEVQTSKEQLKALLYIVGRFRHNFFHGLKDIGTLGEQVENFEHANDLIKLFLDIN